MKINTKISRRELLRTTGAATGGILMASGNVKAQAKTWDTFGCDLRNSRYIPSADLRGNSASELWRLSTGASLRSDILSVDDNLYFIDESDIIYKVSSNGETTTYDQVTGLSVDLVDGVATPTVKKGRIYVGGLDGIIYQIDIESGDTLWTTGIRTGDTISTPLVVTTDQIFVGSTNGIVYALNRESGVDRWQYEIEGPIDTGLCVTGDSLFALSQAGELHSIDIGSGEGEILETNASRFEVAPFAGNENIYVISQAGEISAFDHATNNVQWETNLDEPVTASPALSEDNLFIGTEGGKLVSLDPTSGTTNWETTIDGTIDTGLVATETTAVTATDTGLVTAIDTNNGNTRWEFKVDEAVVTPLTVADDMLYFGTEDSSVYAITSESGVLHSIQSAVQGTTTGISGIPSILSAAGGLGVLTVVGYIGLQKIGEEKSNEESTTHSAGGGSDTKLSGEAIQIRDNLAENNSPKLSLDGKKYTDFDQKRQIGSGGNADVHEASVEINGINHTVALKTPRVAGDNTIDDASISELLEEAEVWDRIDDHERIVTVHGWGSEPLPWIAMEYMAGGTLKQNQNILSSKDIFAQLEGLCEGLHYAHRNGITHTDIKPENILFSDSDTDNIGKFTDWGLANVLLEHSTSVHGLTPDYSAPEQIQPEMYGGTDDRTDIYQLGVVAYELFTDQIPYGGSSHGEMVNAILNAEPPKPSEINPDLPEALDSVLLKAIEKNKQDRYETALHLRDDLRRIYHQCYK